MKKIKNDDQYAGGKRHNENGLRSYRPESNRNNQPKVQLDANHCKTGSVKVEMRIRSSGNYLEGKAGNINGGRKNPERA